MPLPPPVSGQVNEGLWRFSGMYGQAWRDGRLLADVTEVSGAVEINRIEVPLVGRTKTGYKTGRETREGTLRVQKMDAKWEMEIYQYLTQSLQERRDRRDRGEPSLRPFQLVLEYDDPDALGREKWQLDGVLLWRMPVGFNIGDDLVDREFPITWESEQPLIAFTNVVSSSGVAAASYYPGYEPPSR
jgi:hypothetical protein